MRARYNLTNNQNIIILEDLGPWDKHLTITNDIDNILKDLRYCLQDNASLLYYDSERNMIQVSYEYIKLTNTIKFKRFD